jgi:hypothetical protein
MGNTFGALTRNAVEQKGSIKNSKELLMVPGCSLVSREPLEITDGGKFAHAKGNLHIG